MLDMWSSDLSPTIFKRDLLSTAIVRSRQPRTKYLALSSASAMASASLSIGVYRDSAALVKRLPTRVFFQPVLQQNGSLAGHRHCF